MLTAQDYADDGAAPAAYIEETKDAYADETLDGGNSARHTLGSLRDAMLSSNPELLKLGEEYRRSVLDVKDAYAGFGPTVDLQLSGTYLMNPPIGSITVSSDDLLGLLSWPAGFSPSSPGRYITLYDGMESTWYNAQIVIQQPIFTWGKIYNAVRLYRKISDAKGLQLSSTRRRQETELETRLTALFYLDRIQGILREEQDYADRLVSFTETAERTGMLLHQDVLDARMQAKRLEIARRDVEEQVSAQLIEIEKLTGIENLTYDDIDFMVDESAAEEVLALDRADVMERALSSEQETMHILSLMQDISDLAVRISKGYVNWKPDVAMQMSFGYGGPRFPLFEPNWLRKDDYTLNLSVGIRTTIWDGGKKVRDVSRKISEARTASIEKDDARSTIRHTLEQQWNTADVCSMRMEYQDLKIETAELKIRQQEVLHESGYGSESDLLSAKIDLCNERIEKEKQALERASACMMIRFLAE